VYQATLNFKKLVHPEDLLAVDQAFQNAIQNGIGYELESRILKPDGSLIYIYTKAEVKRSLNGENALIIERHKILPAQQQNCPARKSKDHDHFTKQPAGMAYRCRNDAE